MPAASAPPVPILLSSYYLDLGGSERQLTETAIGLDRTQFSPHVAVFREQGFRLAQVREAGIPIFNIGLQSFGSPQLLRCGWQFRQYLRTHRIAITHSFDVPLNIFTVPVARAAGVPVVLSSQRASRELTPGWQWKALRATDRLAHGVVVNCLAMRDHMLAEGMPANRIHLCYNSVDINRFSPQPEDGEALRRQECGDGNGPLIGIVCGLRREKGVDTLLRAFALLRQTHPGARLLIVGSGPAEREIWALASALGLDSVCRFEPASPASEKWLRAMDIFVQPSLSEALSNALMEAMACGCAVVASRTGGNPELVDDGETGFLFPAGDEKALAGRLLQLLDDAGLRTRFATAARRRMRDHFSPAASLRAMAGIYRAALARRQADRLLAGKREVHR